MRDPVRIAEMRRRNLGMERRLQIFRAQNAHPRQGGSRGYPVEMRQAEIDHFLNGLPTIASQRSIYRWMHRLHPFLQGGNRNREVLVGLDQFLMCLCLLIWPDALEDEIIAFIANMGRTRRVYSRSQVSERMLQLDISLKVTSTEAIQASLPINLMKRQIFWSSPIPFGVAGVDRRNLIDVDECGIEIERVNRGYGHSAQGIRIVKAGHYSKAPELLVLHTYYCNHHEHPISTLPMILKAVSTYIQQLLESLTC
mmetsp:Transcript_6503/g.9884  ORF Transcript_6503/g.9884 Transcript_6503/m.9884 type:complete len:254 (+) Transcript_6503:83-844(+)